MRDGEGPGWSAEVKHGKQIPKTVLKWWKQCCENTYKAESSLLVLHPLGWAIKDSLAVITLERFKELLEHEEKAQREDEVLSDKKP